MYSDSARASLRTEFISAALIGMEDFSLVIMMKKSFLNTRLVRHGLTASIVVVTQLAHAQAPQSETISTVANSDHGMTLQDVVITANRLPTKMTDVLADVSVIDRAQLDLVGQGSLLDVLGNLPGVQISRNGSYRSSSGVFLRGASSSQTLILLDGVRIGSATSGTPALENLPLERIERIEVLRGAASALYGSDAVGGVIQIFTREIEPKTVFGMNAGIGSVGQKQVGMALRGSADKLGYSVGWSREQADGVSVIDNPLAASFNPDRDGFTATSVDAKLRYAITAQHQLQMSALHSETRYQFDGSASPNLLKLNKSNTDARAYSTLNNLAVTWRGQLLPIWNVTVMVGAAEDQSLSRYFRIPDAAFGGSNTFNTRRHQLGWQNDFKLGDDVLSIFVEQRRDEVESSTNYAVKARDIQAALLSYAWHLDEWNALAVLRQDQNSQFGEFTNWSLSTAYALSPTWRAVASAGTSFQAPSFNQLYFPGFGNPALTPQQNRSHEVGLKYRQDVWHAEASVYQNDVHGFINPSNNLQSALAILRGATLSASWRQGGDQFSVSYDYADPRTKPNNQRLVRIARHVVNLRAQHQWHDWSLLTELKYSSDRVDNNLSFNGRDTLAAYSLINLGASWQLNAQSTVLVRINNVTDRRYVLANTYSTPGRNVFVSWSWRH